MNEYGVKIRSLLIFGILLLMCCGLGARLVCLHLCRPEEERSNMMRLRKTKAVLTAPRGVIVDRNGESNIMALNVNMKHVCADPSVVSTSALCATILEDLSSKLEVSRTELDEKINKPGSRFAFIRKYVYEDETEKISHLKGAGVFLRDVNVRHYPHSSLMCHVLGYIDRREEACGGVEQQMNRYLMGSDGYLATGVDARRKEMYWRREQYTPPVQGATVELTLDQNVQYIVEKALDDAVAEHNAKGGWAIVQKVRTGEILAMASRPGFDLNRFNVSDESQRMNRTIGYNYEPGSTFKVVAISAALNEKVVAPSDVFDCENGRWFYAKRALNDYHPYGKLTVADGVKKSSNILTAKVALRLGEKKLYQYLKAYGVGSRTGIDLPGEEAGSLAQLKDWYNISITRIPIGQGVAVTALQMISIFSAIANDGFMMKPHVVKRVTRADGKVIFAADPEVVAHPIRQETAGIMNELLARVTEEGGTGRRGAVQGYRVAGKTGTAQKAVAGGYSSTAHIASFVGYLPVGDPEIAIIVVVDEPQPIRTGGMVAAPVFRVIAEQVIRYLDVPPLGRNVATVR